MSSAYDQQLRKLIEHIQTLNQALHERNAQIVQWQQVARALQDERGRIAKALFDAVKQAMANFAHRFAGLRNENKKLRTFIDHQRQMHEVVARDMQGQLLYALSRIDALAAERGSWRQDSTAARLQAARLQQQGLEQKGVIDSQQAALGELKRQLESAIVFAQREEQHQAELKHAQQDLATLRTQLASQDQHVAARDQELARVRQAYDGLKQRASQDVHALQGELAQARQASAGVDERVDEMARMLANSEREVARLFKELGDERTLRKEAEIRLEAATKDLRKAKSAVTRLEKAEKAAKGEQLSDLQKRIDEMTRDYRELQEELASALRDKTAYMQALEGQKGKVRPLPPPSAEPGSS